MYGFKNVQYLFTIHLVNKISVSRFWKKKKILPKSTEFRVVHAWWLTQKYSRWRWWFCSSGYCENWDISAGQICRQTCQHSISRKLIYQSFQFFSFFFSFNLYNQTSSFCLWQQAEFITSLKAQWTKVGGMFENQTLLLT